MNIMKSYERIQLLIITIVVIISTQILKTTLNGREWPERKFSKGYLISLPNCKIPDYDPFAPNMKRYINKLNYEDCIDNKALTKIIYSYNNNTRYLYLDENLKRKNYKHLHYCCYQEITRFGKDDEADNQYKLSPCTKFSETIELKSNIENILVKCKKSKNSFDFGSYKNAHNIIQRKPELDKRIKSFSSHNTKKSLSVLLIGIDSISRLNFIRSMPLSYKYVTDNKWFELRGYTKIEDNTFPNLMGVLTGYDYDTTIKKCNPAIIGKLDSCQFIWKKFEKNGYVTAYAEDEPSINTFNYLKKGFTKQPTDYYLRPFLMAAENFLPTKIEHNLHLCLGYKHAAEYVYDFALEFAKTYENDSYFGLFWTSTFSHNNINDPSAMDIKMEYYLKELEKQNILNNSMIVFFSDHGIRFGPMRRSQTGWLEERLPFIYISLPKWFQNNHPKIVKNLRINRDRLSNHYDLYVTLNHILELSTDHNKEITRSESCPKCDSLFKELPTNRTCDDIMIYPHWCTCTKFDYIDKNSDIIKEAIDFIIKGLNNDIKNLSKDNLCAELKLKNIQKALKGSLSIKKNVQFQDYTIVFETKPGIGIFEATVRYFMISKNFNLSGSVSRLNEYNNESYCIDNSYLKKYCVCKK